MAKSYQGPGRYDRKGLSLIEVMDMFPDEESAEKWFTEIRWPSGVCCPACGSLKIQNRVNRKPQPYWCKDCHTYFSVKTGSVMHSSNIPLRKWAIATYLMMTNLKGVSSMKLHRDLKISQKAAWHMAHRIRETWSGDDEMSDDSGMFYGPVEVDETYIGGKRSNMSNARRRELADTGRGPVGKTPVVGIKDRATNQIVAKPMDSVTQDNVDPFIKDTVSLDAMVYTDDSPVYNRLEQHESVCHSVREYVRGQAHTNGIESFWAMLKRGLDGTYHKMSRQHLHRYVNEFAGRHNLRPLDTIDQMRLIAASMFGKTLRYEVLVGREE